jgi:hypothetical protein
MPRHDIADDRKAPSTAPSPAGTEGAGMRPIVIMARRRAETIRARALVIAVLAASAAWPALRGDEGPGRPADKAASATRPAAQPGGRAVAQEPPRAAAAVRQTVQRLVSELGSDRFQAREAAMRELIRMGEGVLPVLEALGAPADPEARLRLERVRYALVGWSEDLIQLVSSLGPTAHGARPAVPDQLAAIVRQHQPRSGEKLPEMIQKPDHPLRSRAVAAFVAAWDTMSAGQIQRDLRAGLRCAANLRPRYPQGVPAMIGMQYNLDWGHAGLPAGGKLGIVTTTTHYLDGKVYGKPFVYEADGPGAGTGWVRVGELARGRHTLHLATEFSLSHQGKRVKVAAESPRYVFEVAAADVPDDLAAERDAKLDALVKRSLRFAGFDAEAEKLRLLIRGGGQPADPTPQVTWGTQGSKDGSLYLPTWQLAEALPVDLCFEVELQEVASGAVHRAEAIVVLAGRATRGYFFPHDVHRFAGGREGGLELRVVLKPSRAMALTRTDVKRYYTGTITSQPLKARIERK